MKKLLMITLSLLLFTILISPVQAKRPGPLDRPLPEYNNLSLRQIFEDGQYLTYATHQAYQIINVVWDGNNVSFKNTTLVTGFLAITPILPITETIYYYRFNISGVLEQTYRISFGNSSVISYILTQQNQLVTAVVTRTIGNRTNFEVHVYDSSGLNHTHSFNNILLYNLTALGIPTATKIEMDNLYLDYLKYKNMMNATDVMLIVGQLGAFVWSLVVSFEVFGFVLWEYALFGIGAGFIGYLALKIIHKKAGDDNGDSD